MRDTEVFRKSLVKTRQRLTKLVRPLLQFRPNATYYKNYHCLNLVN